MLTHQISRQTSPTLATLTTKVCVESWLCTLLFVFLVTVSLFHFFFLLVMRKRCLFIDFRLQTAGAAQRREGKARTTSRRTARDGQRTEPNSHLPLKTTWKEPRR